MLKFGRKKCWIQDIPQLLFDFGLRWLRTHVRMIAPILEESSAEYAGKVKVVKP